MPTITTPTPYVDDIAQEAVKLCREDHRPVKMLTNRFGGYDLRDEHGRVVRITQSEPEDGVELYMLRPNGNCCSDARFALNFPADVVAMVIPNAFLI